MLRKLLFLLLLLPALSARAQVVLNHLPPPRYELYGGYSMVFRDYNHTQADPFAGTMNGWDTSLRIPVPVVGSWLGIKGDVSGVYRHDAPDFSPQAYFFLAGPQASLHLGHSTLFAHVLVGSAHLNQQVIPSLKPGATFAMAAGAGLDFGLSRSWAVRVTGDFYNTDFHSSEESVQGVVNSNGRISTGLVWRF